MPKSKQRKAHWMVCEAQMALWWGRGVRLRLGSVGRRRGGPVAALKEVG